jgi:hypothetical protein
VYPDKIAGIKRGLHITANVGTDEKFLFGELFDPQDRFPYISVSFARIILVCGWIFQDNSSAISDRNKTAKIH